MHIGWISSSGTTGDLLDMPASDNSATWDGIHVARFADGPIAEHWAVIDQLGMLTQLGFIRPGASA
ncbi:MAG: ester cyclase [Acidimicrobiales bacterium]